jgi:hypothetical protein
MPGTEGWPHQVIDAVTGRAEAQSETSEASPTSEAGPTGEVVAVSDDDYCWVCEGPVTKRHCKIVCPRCGFTRDCSDP